MKNQCEGFQIQECCFVLSSSFKPTMSVVYKSAESRSSVRLYCSYLSSSLFVGLPAPALRSLLSNSFRGSDLVV